MATKKKLLQAAAGTAAASGGAGALNVEDVFSTYLYEGNGSFQAIGNGIKLGQSGEGGSISLEAQADGLEITQSSDFNLGTGDFTCEAWVWLNDSNTTYRTMFGFDVTGGLLFQVWNMQLDLGIRGTSSTTSTSSLSALQWNHLAVVRSSGTVYLFINGTLDRTATVDGASNSWSTINLSNLSNALIGDYSKGVTNFNGHISNLRVSTTARYTATFTVPTSALSSDANTVLLIGQNDDPFVDQSSSSHSATPYGSPSKSVFGPFDAADAGEGGLVWIKRRPQSGNHQLFDTERGVQKRLRTNTTAAESSDPSYLTAFNSNGFSVGSNSDINSITESHASWTFRKAPKFFDVQTWSGTTGSRTISHDLNGTVGCIIFKRRDSNDSWWVVHRASSGGFDDYYTLDTSNASNPSSGVSNVTSSSFDVSSYYNGSGSTWVAYIFAHNDGDGDFGDGTQDIIKCGSYTGNGSTTGPVINLGFEPQWVMVKAAVNVRSDTSNYNNWAMFDTMRGMGVVNSNDALAANLSESEGGGYLSGNFGVSPTSTGFKITTSESMVNYSGATYIYIAIRRGPMAVPTDATDVFAIDQGINSSVGDRVFNAGFPVDLMIRTDPTTTYNRLTLDRLRGNGAYVITNGTDAETDTAYAGEFDDMEGVFTDTSFDFSNHYAYMWQRRPSFCDVVAYSGSQPSNFNVTHNLTVAPELVFTKSRSSTSDWGVYTTALGNNTNWLKLNSTDAVGAGTGFMYVTDTELQINSTSFANAGSNMIAYLFASVDGVSKVGSYTGTGAAGNQIDCGFSSGARFVLIKAASSAGSWNVFDTERGIVAGNDARLKLNNTNAEDSTTDIIDPYNSGFELANDAGDTNSSGVTYIFYAIA